eukprot:TRINITY_DN8319_c0_g1_i1.p1 TRINITY_DN8319_c0_g1~~TRINITY_DN8319_c0_g1_i1.p1  ORF type:complete len:262 (-),score=59.17 TRINITY_DN8319_c0_g1_i1:301-1086(-)
MEAKGTRLKGDAYGATKDSWIDLHGKYTALADTIHADINDRNRLQANRINVTKQNAHIRKSLRDLSDGITTLEDMLQRNAAAMGTEREISRRSDKLNELKLSRDQLQAKYQKGAPDDAEPAAYQAETKKSRAWGAAASGQAQETEYTRNLATQDIVAQQQKVIQDQDAAIDQIGKSVARQKHIAIAVGDELNVQSRLLDDLESEVDKTASNITKETTHVNKVLEKSSMKGLICCLVLCIVIFVVLAVTKWGCTIFNSKDEC